jgi:predicted lipid-binding transport protein (Tim44 family)
VPWPELPGKAGGAGLASAIMAAGPAQARRAFAPLSHPGGGCYEPPSPYPFEDGRQKHARAGTSFRGSDQPAMQNFDMTTLVFLALAVFVAWKLRSVLGQKTGHEKPPVDPFARRETPPLRPDQPANGERRDNVVRLPGAANDAAAAPVADAERWKDIAEPGSPIAAGLDAIVRQEPRFEPQGFLVGAKSAYETIVTAFARGDRKTLKGLLAKEVYDGFEQAIAEREKRGEKAESNFVSIDKAEIVGVDVKGKAAQVTIAFVSQLISAVRDAQGNVVDGSADAVSEVNDVWTFARQLGSRDPNWLLVATESAA